MKGKLWMGVCGIIGISILLFSMLVPVSIERSVPVNTTKGESIKIVLRDTHHSGLWMVVRYDMACKDKITIDTNDPDGIIYETVESYLPGNCSQFRIPSQVRMRMVLGDKSLPDEPSPRLGINTNPRRDI